MRSNWSDPEIESALIATLRPAAVPVGAADRMIAALPVRIPALSWWRQRPVRYALAIVGAAILVLLAASPQARDAVASTVRHVFYYLPGQGVQSTSPESLILPNPVSSTQGRITVRVDSVLANDGWTTVAYEMTGLPGGKIYDVGSEADTAYLLDPSGRRYQLRAAETGAGGSPGETIVNGLLTFEPLRSGVRNPTLVIGAWRVRLSLMTPAQAGIRPAELTANVVTLHGVSLRLDRVDRAADRLVAHLSGRGARLTRLQEVDLPPEYGSDTILPGSGQAGEWNLQLPAGATSLRIQAIHVVEPGATTVYLTVPRGGSFSINKTIHLGEYEFVLTRGEWVQDGNGRSLYLHFRPANTVDGGQIEGMDLDGVGSYGVEWLYATRQGTITLQDVGWGYITLHFVNPRAVIAGPWELPLTTN